MRQQILDKLNGNPKKYFNDQRQSRQSGEYTTRKKGGAGGLQGEDQTIHSVLKVGLLGQ